MKTLRTLASAATIGGLITPWTATTAQETPTTVAPEVTKIEEIVVTATRRIGYIDDIPASISAYGGEDLKAVGQAFTHFRTINAPKLHNNLAWHNQEFDCHEFPEWQPISQTPHRSRHRSRHALSPQHHLVPGTPPSRLRITPDQP